MVMLQLEVGEDLIARLKARAEKEQRTVQEVAVEVIATGITDEPNEPPSTTMEALWQAARMANFRSDYTDTSERVNEILRTEYTKYLLERYSRQNELEG
jgi:hypothetical protein